MKRLAVTAVAVGLIFGLTACASPAAWEEDEGTHPDSSSESVEEEFGDTASTEYFQKDGNVYELHVKLNDGRTALCIYHNSVGSLSCLGFLEDTSE